jgi:hypothetical protein
MTDTPGDRLKMIREQKMKFATASQAARFLNVATPTYLSHENGTRKISAEWADRYAEAFGISPTWLLYNRGAPDEQNTFVGPVASSPSAQRQPARMQNTNPLLAIFEVSYAPDGSLRPLPGVRNADAPAWLPTISAANGFIAELVHVPFPERESRRIIRVGGPDAIRIAGPDAHHSVNERSRDVFFGLDDFIRLPPDMISSDMAFAVRIRTADLIESASGLDRAVVDPADRVPFKSALYYVLINRKAVIAYLVPVDSGADQASLPTQVRVHETRFEAPQVWSLDTIIVFGRVVAMVMVVSKQVETNLVKLLPGAIPVLPMVDP